MFAGSWKHDERSLDARPGKLLSATMSQSVEADSVEVVLEMLINELRQVGLLDADATRRNTTALPFVQDQRKGHHQSSITMSAF